VTKVSGRTKAVTSCPRPKERELTDRALLRSRFKTLANSMRAAPDVLAAVLRELAAEFRRRSGNNAERSTIG
jgi:hypothetical protein